MFGVTSNVCLVWTSNHFMTPSPRSLSREPLRVDEEEKGRKNVGVIIKKWIECSISILMHVAEDSGR